MKTLNEVNDPFWSLAGERGTMTMELPGDDDDPADGEGDWSDIDDEDFEDMAEDDNDLHEIQADNNILDDEDDDHLPDEDE